MDPSCIEYQLGDTVPINSRAKGARFERWLAGWFRDEGFSPAAKRGCQHMGRDIKTGDDAPDVIVPGITDWMHIEAKAVERLQLQEAMDQARRDAGEKIPCVIHKRNNCEPLFTMPLSALPKFLRGDLPPETPKENINQT